MPAPRTGRAGTASTGSRTSAIGPRVAGDEQSYRLGAALDHLRHAIEMSEEFRASAKTDPDLDPTRDQPAFKQLIND
jgi:hypothetical protein